jgi:hypothetical protein
MLRKRLSEGVKTLQELCIDRILEEIFDFKDHICNLIKCTDTKQIINALSMDAIGEIKE